MIKNSAGCRRVFGVKMWGDRPSRVKLTGNFGDAIEAIRISNRLPLLVFVKNSWRCNFRLLQQYRHKAEVPEHPLLGRYEVRSGHDAEPPEASKLTQSDISGLISSNVLG